MLEIIAIIIFCRFVGKTLRSAGLHPLRWQLLTIVLWFCGEIVGGIVGAVLFGPGRQGQIPLGPYILAILGAFGGACLAASLAQRRAARAIPNPTTCPACGYSRAGLPPQSPCPECGTAPAP